MTGRSVSYRPDARKQSSTRSIRIAECASKGLAEDPRFLVTEPTQAKVQKVCDNNLIGFHIKGLGTQRSLI